MTLRQIKRFRVSIYGVLCDKGKILVTETRGKGDVTFINFPGGGIQRGEEPAHALAREFEEETGLSVRPERILWASLAFHRSHVKPDRQLVGMYWLVTKLGGKLKNGNAHDVLRTAWASPEELLDLPFTTFDREALPGILARLGLTGTS